MCNIVPVHLYNNLLVNGDVEEKTFASNALEAIKGYLYNPGAVLKDYLGKLATLEAETEAANRTIYDAEHSMSSNGKLVRSEGEKSNGDVSVDEAYDGSGKTFDFFMNVFKRNSIDDKGMGLKSVVHVGKNFGNAYWHNSTMHYGDGDNGRVFNRFTSVLDVIAHEMSHGITERTAGLEYYSQSGALNEHFSDVFGCLVKQYDRKQTADKADWLIGEGLFGAKIKARGLRDMKNPGTAYNDPKVGKDPQTAHMKDYNTSEQDNQCVHINSGIPNRAFTTAALNLGGFAWEKMGRTWYETLTKELGEKSNFQDCRNATVRVAGRLYGDKSIEQKAIMDGWSTVGINNK